MRVVTLAVARAQLDQLLARAEAGEKVIITRNGKPVAELGPPASVQYGDFAGRGIALDKDLSLSRHATADFECPSLQGRKDVR